MINAKSSACLPQTSTSTNASRKKSKETSKFFGPSSNRIPSPYIPPSYVNNLSSLAPPKLSKLTDRIDHNSKKFLKPNLDSCHTDPETDPDADADGSDDQDLPDPMDLFRTSQHVKNSSERTIPPFPSSSSPQPPEVVHKKRRLAIQESDDDKDSDSVEVISSSKNARKKQVIPDDDDDDDDAEIQVVSKKPARKKPLVLTEDDDIDLKILSGKRKWKQANEDIDDGSDWDAGGEVDEEETPRAISDEDTLHFFNTCQLAELPAVTACTIEQAKIIASLRPFEDPEDLRKKLRKQKGVSSSVFNQYQEIMKGYIEVDRVLTKCEAHGSELSKIMNIWAGQEPNTILTSSGAVELVELADTRSTHPALKSYIHAQPSSVPNGIKLKSYQLLGLNWLNLLYSKRISCILADEMGLGKTAQVVSFLSHLKLTGRNGPHLVIVPASTLDNWLREFQTFSSNLQVRAYYGTQAERAELRYELKGLEDLDVMVTTYNVAAGGFDDRKFLDRMKFEACVYDEGHQLKNSESKKYKDLMRMRVGWRLLLTGTPLQNNLQELVSLLSFILPSIFQHAKEDLKMIFKVPVEAQANLLAQTRVTRAKRMMSPFVLRRKKAQVLSELPRKIESIVTCTMSKSQREIYQEILSRSKKHLLVLQDDDDEDEVLPPGKKRVINKKKPTENTTLTSTNVLMELRKAANHHMLFRRIYHDRMIREMAQACLKELEFHDRDVDLIVEDMEIMTDYELHLFCTQYKHLSLFALQNEEWMESGKISKLKELVLAARHSGSRVLVFSQFTQMLAILEQVLSGIGIQYLILTGSTSVGDRQPLVDRFTTDESITVFLLSTKAGGLGLNLMAADTVVIYDQDFNPHNDRQAEDRAYRLGQKRDVKVMRFVTQQTIEEDIWKLAQTKIALDTSVSTEDDVSGEGLTEKVVKNSLMATLRERMKD